MVYYSIKESAELTGVSLSTVKRKLTKFKNEHPKKYKDKGNIKFEKSKAGNAKTLISESWLREYFDIGQSGSSEPLTLRVEGGANQDVIRILEKQLDAKDKQIEALQEQRKEDGAMVRALTDKIGNLQEAIQDFTPKLLVDPISPKKKSWVKRLLNK
jgi:DNA-binding transcriptional MerR regulator